MRLACGLLLGAVLGVALWLRERLGVAPGLAVMAAGMAGCAWGALRWGDEFWMGILGRGR